MDSELLNKATGGLAEAIGGRIERKAREALGETGWEGLDENDRALFSEAARLTARIRLRELAGEDVTEQRATLQAIAANLAFERTHQARRAFREAALFVFRGAGEFVRGVVL